MKRDDFSELALSSDIFTRDILVNLPYTKKKRVEISKKWWEALYYGDSLPEYNNFIEKGLNSLSKFRSKAKGNFELCNILIGGYFSYIKEIFSDPIYMALLDFEEDLLKKYSKEEISYFLKGIDSKMRNRFLEDARKKDKNFISSDGFDTILDKVEEGVDNYIMGEYEKMKKYSKVLGDEIAGNLGWDLSSVSKREIIDMEDIYSSIDEDILDTLNEIISRDKIYDYQMDFNEEQKKKDYTREPSEVFGIEKGHNLSRVLPKELTKLKNPTLKKIFYNEFIHNRLDNYQLGGIDIADDDGFDPSKYRKGPIILCIDTSSSMKGSKERVVKGAGIDLVKLAFKEEREIHIILFSGEGDLVRYSLSGKGIKGIFPFLRESFYGGTDFIGPINEAIAIIKEQEYKFGDIVFFTDGLVSLPKEFIRELDNLKEKKFFKITTLLVDKTLVKDEYSDEVVHYPISGRNRHQGEYKEYVREFTTNHG